MADRNDLAQLTIAKLPLAKDLADFQFEGTPINQTLVNDLASGAFFAHEEACHPKCCYHGRCPFECGSLLASPLA
jgi:hypothetical protein